MSATITILAIWSALNIAVFVAIYLKPLPARKAHGTRPAHGRKASESICS